MDRRTRRNAGRNAAPDAIEGGGTSGSATGSDEARLQLEAGLAAYKSELEKSFTQVAPKTTSGKPHVHPPTDVADPDPFDRQRPFK